MPKERNRILISGGNGFLGSHLVDKALKEDMDVTVVDDLSTSEYIQVPKKIEFIRRRIEDFKTSAKFDYVVHLAAHPSPEEYLQNPLEAISSNSEGTKVMLDIALSGKAVFMYTSSSEIYGEASIIPTPESYFGYTSPSGPRSCYDESKRFSEALVMAYHRKFGLDTRIQRPFNVYGPRIREDGFYGRVIPRFIFKSITNERLPIFGTGDQTRSFLYIEDWIAASWKLLTLKGLGGKIVNVGSEQETTINDLALTIKKLTGSKSTDEHLPAREDDPTRRAADITLAKKLLGWSPKTGLESGLNSTIEWLRRKHTI